MVGGLVAANEMIIIDWKSFHAPIKTIGIINKATRERVSSNWHREYCSNHDHNIFDDCLYIFDFLSFQFWNAHWLRHCAKTHPTRNQSAQLHWMKFCFIFEPTRTSVQANTATSMPEKWRAEKWKYLFILLFGWVKNNGHKFSISPRKGLATTNKNE